MPASDIEREFPRLRTEGYIQASPQTGDYNCIAFAGDDTTEKWDPDITTGRYWPNEVARSLDLESFIKLYEFECRYVPCENGDLEAGFEKIVIYLNLSKEVTHAAKQLPSGEWASKLGDWEDIQHKNPSSLESPLYGNPVQFLKRPVATQNPP